MAEPKGTQTPALVALPEADALEALAEAVEAGAGMPEVTRAAARVLGASVAVIDRSSAVLAVAAPSQAEERRLLAGDDDVAEAELRVGGEPVGTLRFRARRGTEVDAPVARLVAALVALELERLRAPGWADEEASAGIVRDILDRTVTDRDDLLARAVELGAKLEGGGGVLIARIHPQAAQSSDWRARVLTLATRAARAVASGALVADLEAEPAEVAAIVPADGDAVLERAAHAVHRELEEGVSGLLVSVAHSRRVQDPVDLFRAGNEARLALNVGAAEGERVLAFEATGSYRLLLPAMSEDPGELERFYQETIEPLAVYDDQYETDLVATLEAYLDHDGNVAATAQTMYTHRHTIRYRLERVKELSGHDVSATEGREKLGLGLKAMRVLGIASPAGPAHEPGAEGGQVPPAGAD